MNDLFAWCVGQQFDVRTDLFAVVISAVDSDFQIDFVFKMAVVLRQDARNGIDTFNGVEYGSVIRRFFWACDSLADD